MRGFSDAFAEYRWRQKLVSDICLDQHWGLLSDTTKEDARQAEAILAERLRRRDSQALATLYYRYGKLAYTVIVTIVRDSGIAEDLVQETFLQVWNRINSFDPARGALRPWVLKVARNRAIDYLRSADGKMSARAVNLHGNERLPSISGDEAALFISDKTRLEAAFKKLTPNQQQVIQLAYYEGLSQSEMAGCMNQPLGTVKTWVRAALIAMRDQMA